MPTLIALAPLILQYGVPFVESLYKMFTQQGGPTQADWDALKAASSVTAKANMIAALQRAGIDPNSDAGKALLALTPS